MPFPLVNPGDRFKPSASLSNAVRRHLNETDGFGSGVNLAKNTHFIRVPVFNTTGSTIPAGKAVSLQLDGNMRGDAYPVVAFDEDYPCFGVCLNAIESGKIGDCVLSGIAVVSISGGTEGAYLKPVEGGTFERGNEGVQIINISGSSAVVMLGDYFARREYDAGQGINSDLLTGGTISLNLIGVDGCTVTPVAGSTNGQMQVSCTGGGGGGGGGEFVVPPYSSLTFGGGAPEYGLGHTFILAVKAGDVGFYDDGGGAVGKWTNKSGTASQNISAGSSYHATEDGFLRISVVDNGLAPGACMGFGSPTGGFPLYKYGSFGSVTGIGCTLSGGTASIMVTGGTGSVKIKGDGTVQITGVRRTATPEEISEWGRRYNPATGQMDGDYKNAGWRGIIPLANGSVMTEYSVSEEIGGVEVGYPLIVPTTTDEELKIIEQAIIQEDDSLITQSIETKAYNWAVARIAENKSPFFNGDEEDEQLRKIDDSIIVSGIGATGIQSSVSNQGVATISLSGGTGSVDVVGSGSITISGGSNGEIIIHGATSGGGGGGGDDAVIIYQEEHTELGQITAQTNKKYYIALFGALYYDSESYNYVCQYYITYDHSTTPYTIVRHKTDYSDLESYWQGDGYSLELVLPTPNEDCYVDICLFAFSNILISSAKPIYNYQGAPCAQPYMLGNRNVKLVYIANDHGGRWYLYGN